MAFGWLDSRIEARDLPVLLKDIRRKRKGYVRGLAPGLSAAISIIIALWMLNDMIRYADWGLGSAGQIFATVMYIHLVLILIMAPNESGRMISEECENKTFDQLALTALSSKEIVDQKMAASILENALILICSVPVAVIALAAGGATLFSILGIYALLLVVIVALGYAGVLSSCLFHKSSNTATSMAFFTAILAAVLLPLFWNQGCDRWYIFQTVPEQLAAAAIESAILAGGMRRIIELFNKDKQRQRNMQARLIKICGKWRIRKESLAAWVVMMAFIIPVPGGLEFAARIFRTMISFLAVMLTPFSAASSVLSFTDGHSASSGSYHGVPELGIVAGTLVLWCGIIWLSRNWASAALEALRRGGQAR